MSHDQIQAARETLERILSSPGFARNARMSRFLRLLVERQLEGRGEELKESVIAVEAFGRRPDYDPKVDSIVRTEAARLRARLAEYYAGDGAGERLVIRIPKGGYVPEICPGRSVRPGARPRRWYVVAVSVAAAAAIAAVWWSAVANQPPIRIAVLPLLNVSRAPEHDAFVDGLTDEIINDLSAIDGLSVRSRASSFVLKGQARSTRESGRRLDAEYLLEGSVLLAGERLRITVQLVRSRDDVAVWSSQFERRLTDVFAVQEEIARGIVNSLRLRLGGGRRRYETSVDAYTRYLDGRARSLDGILGVIDSIQSFEQAIAIDPSFAPAYAGLASAYAIRSAQFPLDHPGDELARMKAAAEKAIDLDPLLAEAHAALALARAREGAWNAAEASFRRAIELEPERSKTLTDFALWHLQVLGRNEEALRLLQRAEKVDPLAADVHAGLAWVLMSLERFDEASGHCLELPNEHALKLLCLGRVQVGQGHLDAAIRLFQGDRLLAENPHTRGLLGYALARSGRRDEARRMAAESQFANEQALIYAGLGDGDRAIAALGRMTAVGAQRLGQFLTYPEFASLRGDPRMDTLRQQVAGTH
jgi:serine/threonine-protein kinase